MELTENIEGSGDGPRRSSRKRILKKDEDFHYECDFNSTMYQSTSTLHPPAPQKKRMRTARPSYRMPTVVVQEEAGGSYADSNFRPNSQPNYQPNYQTNYQTNYTEEPETLLVDPVNRQSLMANLVKLEHPDTFNMDKLRQMLSHIWYTLTAMDSLIVKLLILLFLVAKSNASNNNNTEPESSEVLQFFCLISFGIGLVFLMTLAWIFKTVGDAVEEENNTHKESSSTVTDYERSTATSVSNVLSLFFATLYALCGLFSYRVFTGVMSFAFLGMFFIFDLQDYEQRMIRARVNTRLGAFTVLMNSTPKEPYWFKMIYSVCPILVLFVFKEFDSDSNHFISIIACVGLSGSIFPFLWKSKNVLRFDLQWNPLVLKSNILNELLVELGAKGYITTQYEEKTLNHSNVPDTTAVVLSKEMKVDEKMETPINFLKTPLARASGTAVLIEVFLNLPNLNISGERGTGEAILIDSMNTRSLSCSEFLRQEKRIANIFSKFSKQAMQQDQYHSSENLYFLTYFQQNGVIFELDSRQPHYRQFSAKTDQSLLESALELSKILDKNRSSEITSILAVSKKNWTRNVV